MKFFFTAIIFSFVDGVTINKCVEVRGVPHMKQVLQDNVESPYQLAIDHNTNTLFYSYTAQETKDKFKSAYLELHTGISKTIYGIRGGFAHAVNNNNNIVYIGGEDGLYKFDYKTMSATRLHIKEHINIWQMFYKDELYFTTFPEEQVYFFKNYEVVKLHALENIKAMLIAVDLYNNLIYFNSSGVFMYEMAQGSTVFLSGVVATAVTSDRYGNIIFSTLDGISFVNVALKKIIRVADIDDVYGIAIDKYGKIIYATDNSIIILGPATKQCRPPTLKRRLQKQGSSRNLEEGPTKTTKHFDRIIEINIS